MPRVGADGIAASGAVPPADGAAAGAAAAGVSALAPAATGAAAVGAGVLRVGAAELLLLPTPRGAAARLLVGASALLAAAVSRSEPEGGGALPARLLSGRAPATGAPAAVLLTGAADEMPVFSPAACWPGLGEWCASCFVCREVQRACSRSSGAEQACCSEVCTVSGKRGLLWG